MIYANPLNLFIIQSQKNVLVNALHLIKKSFIVFVWEDALQMQLNQVIYALVLINFGMHYQMVIINA